MILNMIILPSLYHTLILILCAMQIVFNAGEYYCHAFSVNNYYPQGLRRQQRTISCLQHRTISMGLEVKIRMVGRKNGGEKWLESAYSTYDTRLKSTNMKVSTQYHKNDIELIKGVESDESKSHSCVLLDPLGKMCTSEVFSEKMYNWLQDGGSRLTFVIGGAEGLPQELKHNRQMISLGMMTFTHQFARVLLMEQIYRASEIRKGSGYHK